MEDITISVEPQESAEWHRPMLSRIRLDQTAGEKSGQYSDLDERTSVNIGGGG